MKSKTSKLRVAALSNGTVQVHLVGIVTVTLTLEDAKALRTQVAKAVRELEAL